MKVNMQNTYSGVPLRHKGKKAEPGKKKLRYKVVQQHPQLTLQEALKLEWPFRVVQSWVEMARSFYPCTDWSMDLGHRVRDV